MTEKAPSVLAFSLSASSVPYKLGKKIFLLHVQELRRSIENTITIQNQDLFQIARFNESIA